jgi:arsenate reductase (thioredoxin)
MKTVIFACVHNAGRSQMAAAFFNAMVNPKLARAVSAGTHPGEKVHPEVLEVMREVGIDLSDATPQQLTDDLKQEADMLISMGCGESCPTAPGLRQDDWPLEDPKGKPVARVREIRDAVKSQVWKLLANEGWYRLSGVRVSKQ